MGVNVKLGNDTVNGVNRVKLVDATDTSTYDTFSLGSGGIPGGYNVTFMVDDAEYTIISVPVGGSMDTPLSPTKTGYMFIGWTINGNAVTFPYTPTADTTMYAEFSQNNHVVVTNLGAQYPSSVTFETAGAFPTSFEEWTDANNNVFIKIPTMYRKVNTVTDHQITSFTISTGKEDNDFEPYPVFIDENDNLMPYVYIGKYCCNNTTTAQSTVSGDAQFTLPNARTLCQNVGTGYQQYDIHFHKLIQDLFLAVSQRVNFQNTTTAITNYLGVYDLDKFTAIDGLAASGGSYMVCYKPSNYSQSYSYPSSYYSVITVGNTSGSGEISQLGYTSNHPFINLKYATVSNTSYNTYYCDQYYGGSNPYFGTKIGGASINNGLWHMENTAANASYLRARLCYRPIS